MILTYLFCAGKRQLHARKLKHKKIAQQLRHLQRLTNICLNLQRFNLLSVRNRIVKMQAFLQERRQMNFQKCSSVYESRRQTSSLAACLAFNVKGAPNKMSSRRCYSGKKVKKKDDVRSSWNKTFSVSYFWLNMKIHWWGYMLLVNLYCSFLKSSSVTTTSR